MLIRYYISITRKESVLGGITYSLSRFHTILKFIENSNQALIEFLKHSYAYKLNSDSNIEPG